MTGAERAGYRKQANTLKPIFQIGKGEINENLIRSVDEALEKRELIKLSLLETASYAPEEAARLLADATGAEIIQRIGRKFVLYRKSEKEDGKNAEG